jgi:hypothetical protein
VGVYSLVETGGGGGEEETSAAAGVLISSPSTSSLCTENACAPTDKGGGNGLATGLGGCSGGGLGGGVSVSTLASGLELIRLALLPLLIRF